MGIETKLIALAIALAALGASFLGYGHYQFTKGVKVTTVVYEAALSKQKAQAAHELANALIDVANAEKALSDFHNSQELKDASNQKYNHDLADRLRNAAGASVRLRDPNQSGCRGGSGDASNQATSATGDRANDSSEGAGLFSRPATELLQRLTREADEVNAAYISCRAVVMKDAP